MIKKTLILRMVTVLTLGLSLPAGAVLINIGSATYNGNSYNLIFEGELGNQGLVWFDYTKGYDTWNEQINWASGLGGGLSVTLESNYIANIDWTTGWRLPSAGENPQNGYDQITSEMGHLFYVSLGKGPGGTFENMLDQAPFENLEASPAYWTGTEYNPNNAWYFYFTYGRQGNYDKNESFNALAVHAGTVSSVPLPPAILLLGSGIMGLGIFRRKFKK